MNHRLLFLAVPILFLAACGKPAKEAPAPVAVTTAPALVPKPVALSLSPASIVVGEKFNVQPDGNSAIGISVKDTTATAIIMFGTKPLDTAHGKEFISAIVPKDLYAKAGTTPVFIRDTGGESNKLDFVVKPK